MPDLFVMLLEKLNFLKPQLLSERVEKADFISDSPPSFSTSEGVEKS